jgi:hypothetical protein
MSTILVSKLRPARPSNFWPISTIEIEFGPQFRDERENDSRRQLQGHKIASSIDSLKFALIA